MKKFRYITVLAGRFVRATLQPGYVPDVPDAYGDRSDSPLDGWDGEELDLMLTEGRRHLSSINEQIRQLRTRAQYYLAIALTTGAATLSLVERALVNPGIFCVWLVALICYLLSVIILFSVNSSTVKFGEVDAVLLAAEPKEEVKRSAARAYPTAVRTSVSSFYAAFSVLRIGVWLFVLAVISSAAVWTLGALLSKV